jgi:hypothetical protein
VIAAHDPLHDFAAIKVTKRSDISFIGGVPPVPPATESHQNVEQILAFLGQPILVTRRSLLVEASVENSGLDQSREPVGENVAGDSQILLKIVKSPNAQEGVAQDQHCPLIADQLGGVGDRTLQVLEALPGWHGGQFTD